MTGAQATAGHRLHVERITLREIRLPLWIHLSCSFSGWQRLSDKSLSSKRRPNKALRLDGAIACFSSNLVLFRLNADRAPQLKAGVSDQIEEGLRSLHGGSKRFEEEEQFTGESEHQ